MKNILEETKNYLKNQEKTIGSYQKVFLIFDKKTLKYYPYVFLTALEAKTYIKNHKYLFPYFASPKAVTLEEGTMLYELFNALKRGETK